MKVIFLCLTLLFLFSLPGISQGQESPELKPPPPVQENPKDEAPFTYVERMPEYPGGQELMFQYMYNCVHCDSTLMGKSGIVYTQFVVEADGKVDKVKIVRTFDEAASAIAQRCVEGMKSWTPGMHNGRAVPVTFTLPVKFICDKN